MLSAATIPLALLLIAALWKQDISFDSAVSTAVAGMVTLIPEGLFLLVSITFAAASITLARRGALAQQLNAVESLASVEVLCLDKTGTLTGPTLRVVETLAAPGVEPASLDGDLARFAAVSPVANATIAALRAAYPAGADESPEVVPFSSRRRWSGARLDDRRLVLGAPELFPLGELGGAVREAQAAGRRVVALGVVGSFPERDDPVSPELLGVAVLAEELRPDARETVAFFREEGVELKVLSGDDPATVASIAADAGIPIRIPPLAEAELPDDPVEFAATARRATVIGRISPVGKRRIVESLRDQGYYVAMVGDGVNDVPALKAARLAIAQGSGTQMARTVSDIVLVTGDFGAVPRMVAEGRKILRNIQRVAKLFVTKSVFAAFLILAIGLTPTAYPLLPRHLTLVGDADGRHPRVLPRARTERRPVAYGRVPARDRPLRCSRGRRGGARRDRDVSRHVERVRSRARRGADRCDVDARGRRALPRPRARGARVRGALPSSGRSARRSGSRTCSCSRFPRPRSFFDLVVPGFGAWLMVAVGSSLAIGFLLLTDERFVPRFRAAGAR